MRDIKKSGLVRYFLDLIDFNRNNAIARPYDHSLLLDMGWTEKEIYSAKVTALTSYFKSLIKLNPVRSKTSYNKRRILDMGWTEREIAVSKKKARTFFKSKLFLFSAIVLLVAIVLLAIKFRKYLGHGL